MKKLISIVLVVISLTTAYSQKFYVSRNNVSKLVNTNVYFGKKETSAVTKFDSLTRCALERFIVDRLNYYRKRAGVQPLVWDEGLRTMCYHHVVYQRLTETQEHTETIDLPNFEEIDISERGLKLAGGRDKYNVFSEGLLSGLDNIKVDGYNNEKAPTIKDLVDRFFTPGRGYNTCDAHWNQIMETQWDRIFIYYDWDCYKHGNVNRKSSLFNVTVQIADAK